MDPVWKQTKKASAFHRSGKRERQTQKNTSQLNLFNWMQFHGFAAFYTFWALHISFSASIPGKCSQLQMFMSINWLFSSHFNSQGFLNIYECKRKCLKLPLTFFLQVSWPTPTDVQALWKGLANILRNIHILDISSIYSAVHPYYHKFSCMISDFRFLVRNSGQTASLMSHTGSDHLFCINCHNEYKRYYNVTANDFMAWSPPAAMWETRETLILGWNDSPQGFQGLTRRTLQRFIATKQSDWTESNCGIA